MLLCSRISGFEEFSLLGYNFASIFRVEECVKEETNVKTIYSSETLVGL
jgi:hypothetical protein